MVMKGKGIIVHNSKNIYTGKKEEREKREKINFFLATIYHRNTQLQVFPFMEAIDVCSSLEGKAFFLKKPQKSDSKASYPLSGLVAKYM